MSVETELAATRSDIWAAWLRLDTALFVCTLGLTFFLIFVVTANNASNEKQTRMLTHQIDQLTQEVRAYRHDPIPMQLFGFKRLVCSEGHYELTP